MGKFVVGSVITLHFPFSDLSIRKKRPAVLLADSGRGDWVACQVTSKPFADPRAIEITPNDFTRGNLPLVSYARPTRLITLHESLFIDQKGQLSQQKTHEITQAIIHFLTG